jgi:nitrate reductase gamma subunit
MYFLLNLVTPEEFPTDKSESTEDNTTAIALGVTFSILLLAGIVIAVICYRRRTSSSNIL